MAFNTTNDTISGFAYNFTNKMIFDLFKRTPKIENEALKRISELEIELMALRRWIKDVDVNLEESKKKGRIQNKPLEDAKSEKNQLEGAILPESESFYKRK